MLVNFFDIIGTKIFSKSFAGAIDISEELMVFLTLLPLAYVALQKGNIRITLLEEKSSHFLKYLFQIIQYITAILVTGLITWRAFVQFQRTYASAQMKHGINIPIWPSNFIVMVSFGLLTIAFILLFAKIFIKEPEKRLYYSFKIGKDFKA